MNLLLLILYVSLAIAASLLIPFVGAYCLWILFPTFLVGNKFWAVMGAIWVVQAVIASSKS